MESDIKARINAARRLADEIARIGTINRHRSSGTIPSEGTDIQADSADYTEASQGGALPVSPPNSLSGKLLRVVVSDSPAKEELCKFRT